MSRQFQVKFRIGHGPVQTTMVSIDQPTREEVIAVLSRRSEIGQPDQEHIVVEEILTASGRSLL